MDQIEFETPESLDTVPKLSDAKKVGQIEQEVQIRQKQLNKKYKHRPLFKNPDGSKIESRPQFLKSQVDHLQNPNNYYSKGVLISKDDNPVDCGLIINDETRHVIIVKLDGDYVAPRQLRTNQYNNFKRHGVIGSDPEKFPDISFIKHGMNAKTLLEHYNFSKHGKITEKPMDSVDIARKFGEIMENRHLGNDTCYDNDGNDF